MFSRPTWGKGWIKPMSDTNEAWGACMGFASLARVERHKESHRINRLPGRRTSNKACNPQPPPSSRYQTQVWGADAKKEVRRKLLMLDE